MYIKILKTFRIGYKLQTDTFVNSKLNNKNPVLQECLDKNKIKPAQS